jgi:hypothetical protein
MQLLVSAPTLWSCLHDADLMSCVDAGAQRLLLCMLRRLCCSSTSERKEDFSAAVRACLSQSLRCVHCSNAAATGKCLLTCLLPVIGWGVWCFIRKKEQPHNAEGPGNVCMPVAAICEKRFRSALPLLIRLINVGRALWRYFAAKTQRDDCFVNFLMEFTARARDGRDRR